MTSLQQVLAKGEFAVTAEVAPPKGTDTAEMMENAEFLRGKVHAVNVTDQQSSVMRLGSLASCRLLKESGFEPVFQLTTRDRNRIALQSDLLSASVLGIENVLCLTGDHITLGDHPQAKPVFDLDSVSLLMAAKGLTGGTDMAGELLEGTPAFHLGAVVTPGYEPMELQLLKMERKIKAGAQFFQTQAVYDPELFRRFMGGAKELGVPVLLGLVLLKSAGMARYMNKHVAGVSVPDSIIDEMKKTDDKVATSIKLAARIIRQTRGDVSRGPSDGNGLGTVCAGYSHARWHTDILIESNKTTENSEQRFGCIRTSFRSQRTACLPAEDALKSAVRC